MPVIVGVWVALLLGARDPGHRWRPPARSLVAAAAAAMGCCLVVLAFSVRASPTLTGFWQADFVQHGSPRAFLYSLGSTSWQLVAQLVAGLPSAGAPGP